MAAKHHYLIPVLFTDKEAWLLFRLAAFGESVGWTCLILGLFVKYHVVHGANWPVAIGGQIHGVLFVFYLAMAVFGGASLRWKPGRALVAIAASVPPYGSLVFEQIESRRRHHRAARQFYGVQTLYSYRSL
jgi:integral membrane protein